LTPQIDPGEATFLGVVQGLTEFLPVSSSGHLVMFQHLLGLHSPELLFDVVVHGGTLLAVLLVYGEDLWEILRESLLATAEIFRNGNVPAVWRSRPYFRLAAYLLIGTVPAAVVGFLFQDTLEQAFASLLSVGGMLLVTGTVLFGTKRAKGPGRELEHLSLRDSLLIGAAQSLALLPGISRSGITIAAGLFCGLKRDLAARFSFLLSMPAILGAHVLQAYKARESLGAIDPLPFLLGGLTALVTGYIALRFLLRVVHKGKLHHFSYYCWTVGTIVLFLSWIGPHLSLP
jgi:undecaprenyl-diphosphatase